MPTDDPESYSVDVLGEAVQFGPLSPPKRQLPVLVGAMPGGYRALPPNDHQSVSPGLKAMQASERPNLGATILPGGRFLCEGRSDRASEGARGHAARARWQALPV